MREVKIVNPFVLTHNDGHQTHFAAGVHQMEDDVADHPFVLAHSDEAPEVGLMPGSQAYEETMNARARRRQDKEAAIHQEVEQAKQAELTERYAALDQEMIDEEQAARDEEEAAKPAVARRRVIEPPPAEPEAAKE